MSQFMVVDRWFDARAISSVVMSPIDVHNELLRTVAMHYFGDWRGCQLVTDVAGNGESLIDDVCDAQQNGTAIEDTPFVRFCRS